MAMHSTTSMPPAAPGLGRVCAILIAHLISASLVQAQSLRFVDLGTFDGVASRAVGVSKGVVVGSYQISISGKSVAFLWTESGGIITRLDTLGGTNCQPQAIDGETVVGMSQIEGDSEYHAFKWTSADGAKDLGTLGGTRSVANAVHNGEIVGGALAPGSEEFQAVRWKRGEEIDPLGTLGGAFSYATGIHGNAIVGYSYTGTIGSNGGAIAHAFLWTPDQGLSDIGTLAVSEEQAQTFSQAWAIHGNLVCGSSQLKPEENNLHAFLWMTAEGEMLDLGTLGGRHSFALAVNSGVVVGSSLTPENLSHAFRWTIADGLRDIHPDGWESSYAVAIDDEGRIVGYVTNNDSHDHACLWTPTPEPPSPLHPFRRADANGDGQFDLSDAVATLLFLFGGMASGCPDSLDANDDGIIELADPIGFLATLFSRGFTPPEPFLACGSDSTPDSLPCFEHPACPP